MSQFAQNGHLGCVQNAVPQFQWMITRCSQQNGHNLVYFPVSPVDWTNQLPPKQWSQMVSISLAREGKVSERMCPHQHLMNIHHPSSIIITYHHVVFAPFCKVNAEVFLGGFSLLAVGSQRPAGGPSRPSRVVKPVIPGIKFPNEDIMGISWYVDIPPFLNISWMEIVDGEMFNMCQYVDHRWFRSIILYIARWTEQVPCVFSPQVSAPELEEGDSSKPEAWSNFCQCQPRIPKPISIFIIGVASK